jgi:hypothetical protein
MEHHSFALVGHTLVALEKLCIVVAFVVDKRV